MTEQQPTPPFSITVIPNASATEIYCEEGAWKARIAAPADKDKANKELIRYLSKILKKRVRIKSGLRSRKKRIVYF